MRLTKFANTSPSLMSTATTMNVALTDALRAFVAERVQSGAYGGRRHAPTSLRTRARYYRQAAGPAVAQRFAQAVKDAIAQLEVNRGIGSPRIGQEIGVPGLRTWSLNGFPEAGWYFERADHVDIARVIGERQDPELVNVGRQEFA